MKYAPNKKIAKERNDKFYFTGKTCLNNHRNLRYTANGACLACSLKVEMPDIKEEPETPPKKVCRKCGFEFESKQCKNCNNLLQTKWRAKNREYYANKSRERKAELRKFTREARDKPCMDCKLSYPWYVMEFDHRENKDESYSTVASLVGKGNLEKIKLEIAKCDLVCANCHKTRTHFRAVENGERYD